MLKKGVRVVQKFEQSTKGKKGKYTGTIKEMKMGEKENNYL